MVSHIFQCSIIPIGEIAEWLRKQSTIEILFRDNLHHPAFCERFFCNYIFTFIYQFCDFSNLSFTVVVFVLHFYNFWL